MRHVGSAGRRMTGVGGVAIYTLRGDCGSVRVAVRVAGGRVYSEDQSYQDSGGVGRNGWFGWPSRALADPQRAPAGYRAIPAQEVGGHLEENARALGQPRDAQVITESGGQSRASSERCFCFRPVFL
jgi:hypothetical protein